MHDSQLESRDKEIREKARTALESYPRMQKSENRDECLKKLNNLMDGKYGDFKETIKKQNKNYVLDKFLQCAVVAVAVAVIYEFIQKKKILN